MDWYVSSAAYAAVPAWAASTAYTVGQIRRPTAAPFEASFAYRCTTAGTSAAAEPTWSSAYSNNATKTDGGVTWTNVTGQSAYGWGAAAGTLYSMMGSGGGGSNRPAVGDRVFVSSDHSESLPSGALAPNYRSNAASSAFGLIQVVSVNRAGSMPPVAADVQSGATIINNNNVVLLLDAYCSLFWQGLTFTQTTANNLHLNAGGQKAQTFKNCALKLTNSSTSVRLASAGAVRATLDNTTLQFGSASQSVGAGSFPFDLIWLNTPAAISGATIPATLFIPNRALSVTCRGVDLSAITGKLYDNGGSADTAKILLDSCKIASGVSRIGSSFNPATDEIELVNCYDGTNVINERYTPVGTITTDRSTTLSGGAQDDIGAYSLKLASSSQADKLVLPLNSFWLDIENTLIGSSRTATVEIISSGSLNNDDISLLLEYMGTSGSSVASLATSLPAVLATPTVLTTSSVTWNNSPATPVKQKLQVTFTPQRAGRVRGLVKLGKPNTTAWINPQIAIA
jgi:hypothetical protein